MDYIDIYLYGNSQENNIITDKLSLFFQEVEMAVKIAPNEIWGIKDNISLIRYLFNKYVTITQIKNELTTFITKYCTHAPDFQYKISVETIKDNNQKDMLYIVLSVVALDALGQPQPYQQKFLIGN